MMQTKETGVRVSIICNAYNHERYIRDALNGFLMQKTNFAFEILIHDDASTDKTADIIREYENKYPEIVKPIYQTVNQYSQGVDICQQFQSPRAKGKYIASCEGDDYWTDPLKLQKQYDAMELHPEVDMCAHCAKLIDADTNRLIQLVQPAPKDCILTPEQMIAGGGGFVATNSLFYRTNLDFQFPKFRTFFPLDYTLQMHGSLRGGVLYLQDTMSVYRFMAGPSWSKDFYKQIERQQKHYEKTAKTLCLLDEETEGRYHDTIEYTLRKNEVVLLKAKSEYKEILDEKYRRVFKSFSWKERIKIRIKAAFPWLLKVRKKSSRK